MKKLLMLVLPVLQITCTGQSSFNHAFHAANCSAEHLLYLGGNFYFSSVRHDAGFIKSTEIVSVDQKSEVRFSTQLLKDEITHVTDMITTANKQILAVGYGRGCDNPGQWNPVRFIARIDTSGNFVFNIDFEPNIGSGILRLAEAPNGEIFVACDSALYRFSQQGQLLSKKNAAYLIHSLIVLTSGNLMMSVTGSSSMVILADTAGTLLNSMQGGPVTRFVKSSGSVIAIAPYGIEKYGPGLSYKISSPPNMPSTAAVLNDTIFAISPQHRYTVLDTAFNVLHTYSLQVPHTLPSFIATGGGKTAFLSSQTTSVIPHSQSPLGVHNGEHFAVTVFPMLSGFSYPQDVGITAVSCYSCIGMASKTVTNPITGGGFLRIDGLVMVDATVKNYGQDTIHSFYLTSAEYIQTMCAWSFHHEHIGGVAIPPGGTISVITNTFMLHYWSIVHSDTVPSSVPQRTFAIFTSAPDDKVDGNVLNDVASTSINLATIIAIDENVPAPDRRVFPNPASGLVTISGTREGSSLEVHNATGQKVSAFQTSHGSTHLDMSALPAGIYFLTINEGPATYREKVIRE